MKEDKTNVLLSWNLKDPRTVWGGSGLAIQAPENIPPPALTNATGNPCLSLGDWGSETICHSNYYPRDDISQAFIFSSDPILELQSWISSIISRDTTCQSLQCNMIYCEDPHSQPSRYLLLSSPSQWQPPPPLTPVYMGLKPWAWNLQSPLL